MTNAEAAKHFASLPPDELAKVVFHQPDNGVFSLETIKPMAGADFENFDNTPTDIEQAKAGVGFTSSW